MKKYKSKKGISFLMVIGSYGSFHFTSSGHSLHLCLGWIAFTIFYYDVENALAQMLEESKTKNSNTSKKIKQCAIGVVSNNEVFSEVAVCDCKAPAFRDEHGNHRCTECNELCNTD